MSTARSSRRSNDEWMQLISECRQSGFSDAEWCRQNDIPVSTFYNAVVRLRKNACTIPERSGSTTPLDLTASKEPVEIHVVSEPAAHTSVPAVQGQDSQHIDNSHMIEITIGTATIRVSNGSDPSLLQSAIMAVGRLSYVG